MIIEFVPFGDLLGHLRKSRGLKDTYFDDLDIKPTSSLTSRQLFTYAVHIANGMAYLSSRKVCQYACASYMKTLPASHDRMT
jgi:hypothetical protein